MMVHGILNVYKEKGYTSHDVVAKLRGILNGIDVSEWDPASDKRLPAVFSPDDMAGKAVCKAALQEHFGLPVRPDVPLFGVISRLAYQKGLDVFADSLEDMLYHDDSQFILIGSGDPWLQGRFSWLASKYPEKFPGLCTPDESYHGVTYTERFGLAGAFITKATAQLMRDFGSIQSPQNAFLLNLGLESLHVRVQRHCENAQKVAEFLKGDDRVAWVTYCGLEGDKYHELAKKYLPNGSCGVVSFGVKGGRKAAENFMKHLKVFAIETHVADARSCCLHPASATHRQMNDDELKAAGVSPDLVRMSVGIENADDLIADIKQALDAVSR